MGLVKNLIYFILSGLFICFTIYSPVIAAEAKCLYVSSYHKGYAWSDGVELGMRKVLTGHCNIRQIDMDTKRNKDKDYIQQTVQSIRQQIESWQPDVVITSDDNAAKYLIQPHYKDARTPFVFCGVNWSAKEYGFPYSNVTGIIEVAPLEVLLSQAVKYSGGQHKVVYLGANTLTEKKNMQRMKEVSAKLNIQLQGKLVSTAEEWKQAYVGAQDSGFIIMGSFSGISNWDKESLSQFAIEHAKILSVTSHEWMMPFSSIGFTKIPQEHCEWAAEAAIEILNGLSVAEIPIVANRKWDIWLNQKHLESTGIQLPRKLVRKAKKVTL